MDDPHQMPDIFIIEEDSDDQILLSLSLHDAGLIHRVRFFPDLYAFLNKVSSYPSLPAPSVILLNGFLPGITIQAALDLLRDQPDLSAIPLVVMVASQWEKRNINHDQGVSEVVIKEEVAKFLARYLADQQQGDDKP